ncbi:MAG TPA: hypothetical protein VG893_16485 [Terracidiphilus sp.]|nr:hypothetical protein [Terracidiphilus sp.]
MIAEFTHLFTEPAGYWSSDPLMDSNRLRTSLFEMGFEGEFLDSCQQDYHWNFASLFPALFEGSFYTDKKAWSIPGAEAQGRQMLLRFATALCRIMAENPNLCSEQAQEFQRSIGEDGWHFVGYRLVATSQDIISEAQELTAVESLICDSVHDNHPTLVHHFTDGRALYDTGSYHACVGEWRAFLEELLRGIWRVTRSHRPEFGGFASKPNMKDIFDFLQRSGFFSEDEKLAFLGAWGFLSAGAHPGIGDQDHAHLSMILALTFGHASLLKLRVWARNSFSHF